MASGKKKNTDNSAKNIKKEKKSFAKWLWLVLIAGLWWFNNYTLKTTVETISSDKIVSKVRLAVISDQHATKLGISNKTIFRTIDNAKPDIVFMDIVMPVITGIDALTKIKEIDPDAKVIMASSVGTQNHLKAAIKAGATDFLQKPISNDQVRQTLENAAKGVI